MSEVLPVDWQDIQAANVIRLVVEKADLTRRTTELESAAPSAEVVEAVRKVIDDLLSYNLSNRGTKHEFVTCRSDGDIHHPALEAARTWLATLSGGGR